MKKAVVPGASAETERGKRTRRVASYHGSACSTRSSGAVRRWWKGWPVEGFSVSQWPLLARQCKARGNDLVPLRRWYAPVAPQPASPSRHVDIAVRLPQREARPTLFSELARQPPARFHTHTHTRASRRPCLFDWSPLFFSLIDETNHAYSDSMSLKFLSFFFFLERINHDSLLSKSWRGLSSISISKLFCKRSNKYVYSNRAT